MFLYQRKVQKKSEHVPTINLIQYLLSFSLPMFLDEKLPHPRYEVVFKSSFDQLMEYVT